MNQSDIYRSALNRHMLYRRKSIEKPLVRMSKLQVCGNSEIFYDMLAEIALHQEMLAMDMRADLLNLHQQLVDLGLTPRYYPLPDAPDIKIIEVDGAFQIELDALLPFATNGSVFYLHTKLDNFLRRYQCENKYSTPVFQKRCAVVFLHHYNKEKQHQLRDYDNMERRCILNVIARYFLIDDDPTSYISMDTIVPDSRTYTEIRIMPMLQFKDFVVGDCI